MRRTRTITKTVTKSVEYRLDITPEQLRKRFSIPAEATLKIAGPFEDRESLGDDERIIATWTVTK